MDHFISNGFVLPSGAILSLYDLFRMNADIAPVSTSAIGNVHHTVPVTLSKQVNRYAVGKTKITSLNSDITSGLIAYPID